MTEDRAFELGRLIGQSREYQDLTAARKMMDQKPELKQRIEELTRLTDRLTGAAEDGKDPSPEDQRSYESLVSGIQSDSIYQAWASAQSNFEKLMIRVNEQIGKGIERGGESSIITLG